MLNFNIGYGTIFSTFMLIKRFKSFHSKVEMVAVTLCLRDIYFEAEEVLHLLHSISSIEKKAFVLPTFFHFIFIFSCSKIFRKED